MNEWQPRGGCGEEHTVKEIHVNQITAAVRQLCMDANYDLPADVEAALRAAQTREESPLCREILGDILKNADIARTNRVPICQDTGLAVFFLEVGQDVHIVGGALEDAVNAGVHAGYIDGCLRKSALSDPLIVRKNTGDNTPAIIHTRLVPGDRLSITIAPKGAGSENMSALGMLKPAQGREGVLRFVVDAVSRAGSNPCPPVIVGVGIGGTIDKTTYLAKRALLREVGAHHPDPAIAAFEAEALAEINRLGIGAQGFGGTVTALAVHVETFPAHLASLPVAVNLQCHVARHKTAVL